MQVKALDPKITHRNNPDCPGRLVLGPDGHTWYCLDCGFAIVVTTVRVKPETCDDVRIPTQGTTPEPRGSS